MEVSLQTRCIRCLEKINENDESGLYFDYVEDSDSDDESSMGGSFILGEGEFRISVENTTTFKVSTTCTNDIVLTTLADTKAWLENGCVKDITIELLIEFIYKTAVKYAYEADNLNMTGDADEPMYNTIDTRDTQPDPQWIKINSLVKRLDEKEKQVRESKGPTSIAKNKSEKIFSSSASSICLRNELIDIIQRSDELGYDIEAIDDDIYTWRVRMSNFNPESDLCMDMTLLFDKYKYSYIEFQVI
jgi:hypothetical protein